MPLTSHISLDAKLKFIHDKIDTQKIDTLIIGSSLGLNNIQGEILEQTSSSCEAVLNIAAYGASTRQAEQLLELQGAFPNLKRIIYSTQYSDFPHGTKIFEHFNPELLIPYIKGELNALQMQWLALKACKDLSFCVKRQLHWAEEHNRSNDFAYLGFDKTGSVPLSIYGDDIVGHRWRNPHPGIMHPKSFEALERTAKEANEKNIQFYLIEVPYRQPLAKRPKVAKALADFARLSSERVTKHGGYFINLHELLHLQDQYFADRTHLNKEGSALIAKRIANMIDGYEHQIVLRFPPVRL